VHYRIGAVMTIIAFACCEAVANQVGSPVLHEYPEAPAPTAGLATGEWIQGILQVFSKSLCHEAEARKAREVPIETCKFSGELGGR
jgi:hypothetical protein